MHAGEPRWVGAQEHAGENIGDTDTRALFIELKEPAPHAVAGRGTVLGLILRDCDPARALPAVAQRGGEAVHGEQDAALHLVALVAGTELTQELDLEVVERLQIREAVVHRAFEGRVVVEQAAKPVTARYIRVVRSYSSTIMP